MECIELIAEYFFLIVKTVEVLIYKFDVFFVHVA